MAACATTYFETGRGWGARIAEHNAELMAQQAQRRRRVRTPEFYFVKHFDNSRLVKASDPVRVREMRVFSAAVAVLFSLIMIYGLQHFSAIESSYRVESEKQTLDQLREGESPVAPERGRAHAARPHRPDGPPAWARRAAAGPGGLPRRPACFRRSHARPDYSSRARGAVTTGSGPNGHVGSRPTHPQPLTSPKPCPSSGRASWSSVSSFWSGPAPSGRGFSGSRSCATRSSSSAPQSSSSAPLKWLRAAASSTTATCTSWP